MPGKPKAADVLPMRQVLTMITYLKGRGKLREAALVAVTAGFGLRIGDALSLRWGDMLGEDGEPRERVALVEQKTGKQRTVHVLPFVHKLLDLWREESNPIGPEELLFPSPRGDQLTRQWAWTMVRRTAEAMGIKAHVSPHSLRKAFCDYVYQHIYDPVMTARITGHSNPAQLLRYIGRLPEAEERLWEKMAEELGRVKV